MLLVGALASSCGKGRHEVAPPESPTAQGRNQGKVVEPDLTGSSTDSGAARPLPPPVERRAEAFQERLDERRKLVQAIADEGISDPLVLLAMQTVPRHAFVSPALSWLAYADRPLPIVGGQTISQPYIVAFMTEAARPAGTSSCLEIGTGSGYQAAVLAEICKRTFSIEYHADVGRFGEENLRGLGYGPDRVALRVGDGYGGWPEAAPFDVVVVTAAPERVPEPLLDQLSVGGRLVIPVGESDEVQELQRWTRLRAGKGAGVFRTETLLPVRFVPFAGGRATRR
jgi:protein-L-isoaspartate(D-aspartate) O-methyltransferase